MAMFGSVESAGESANRRLDRPLKTDCLDLERGRSRSLRQVSPPGHSLPPVYLMQTGPPVRAWDVRDLMVRNPSINNKLIMSLLSTLHTDRGIVDYYYYFLNHSRQEVIRLRVTFYSSHQ
jgi:hypothetical protein